MDGDVNEGALSPANAPNIEPEAAPQLSSEELLLVKIFQLKLLDFLIHIFLFVATTLKV